MLRCTRKKIHEVSVFPWPDHPATMSDSGCLLFIIRRSDWCGCAASNLTGCLCWSGLLSLPPPIYPSWGEGQLWGKENGHKHEPSQPLLFLLNLWGQKFPVEGRRQTKEWQKSDPLHRGVRQHDRGSSSRVTPHRLNKHRDLTVKDDSESFSASIHFLAA